MLSIKNRLIGLSLAGLITATVIGGYCYYSLQSLNSAMNKIVVSSSILRNHMFADMLHDTLNSDVNAALLAAENVGTSSLSTIEAELKEHSESFTEALNKNDKLITDKPTREALEKTLPALRSYIASAQSIVQTAKSDRAEAIKKMDGFHKAFSALEVDMENLTELIEADVKETQTAAESEQQKSVILLIIIFVIGVVLTVMFSLKSIQNIIAPLTDLVRTSERVASGDLSFRVDTSRTDELGQLAQAMEKMRISLSEIISKIGQTTSRLSSSVDDISIATSTSTTSMLSQQSETDQVASAMNEMTATVHEVARNIVATANSAQNATEETRLGSIIVQETVQSISLLASQISEASEIIHRLEQNSHNISSVLDVIRTIAEQTNLLALNAAIEAARAGEQGRGFAVVADEVRTLASRTQASTGEINEMISQLQEGSKSSVDAMTKSTEQAQQVVAKAQSAGQSLQTIAETVGKISALSAQIATAAEEQTAVSEEINRNISHINEAANVTANGTHKTKDTIAQLKRVAIDLEHLMSQFKL